MSQFTINLIQGAVSINFPVTAAEKLKQEMNELMNSLKAITLQASQGGKPSQQAYPNMEYDYTGDVFFEVFCNPNIYPNPFSAKVLITIRDEKIRLTSEAELTRLQEDLENFLANN